MSKRRIWAQVNKLSAFGFYASGALVVVCYFLKESSDILFGFAVYSFLVLCVVSVVMGHISYHFMKKDLHDKEDEDEE